MRYLIILLLLSGCGTTGTAFMQGLANSGDTYSKTRDRQRSERLRNFNNRPKQKKTWCSSSDRSSCFSY